MLEVAFIAMKVAVFSRRERNGTQTVSRLTASAWFHGTRAKRLGIVRVTVPGLLRKAGFITARPTQILLSWIDGSALDCATARNQVDNQHHDRDNQ